MSTDSPPPPLRLFLLSVFLTQPGLHDYDLSTLGTLYLRRH